MPGRDLNFKEQREFEKQMGDGAPPDFPQELLKLYRLRRLMSKAWIPLGISRNEAIDILIWAIGEDVKSLHFSRWPERIMERTGINFDPKTEKIIDVFRKIGKLWQSKKVKPFYMGAE